MSSFILETPIFQEAKIVHQGKEKDAKKAIFRMTMQTGNEVNQNKRMYPLEVLKGGMKNNDERIKRRAMLGEMDHPVPSGNETFDGIRQTTVQLKEASHIVRDYDFRGNHLVGELETTSTPNGAILLGLLKDKSGIGLSMRGMAELEKQGDVNVVKAPLYIITFDSVSLPSHKSAIVNFDEMRFESLSMLTEGCSGVVCYGGTCYLPDYFDQLVETKIIKFFDRWV